MAVGYTESGKLVSIPVSKTRLLAGFAGCEGKCGYLLGAKPAMESFPGRFSESDCSGFVRWLIFHATGGKVLIPDGSFNQAEWCVGMKLKPCRYGDSGRLRDDRVRISFIRARDGVPGHVWLVLNGQTIECCSRRGVCRRPWNSSVLLHGVSACFVLTDTLVS